MYVSAITTRRQNLGDRRRRSSTLGADLPLWQRAYNFILTPALPSWVPFQTNAYAPPSSPAPTDQSGTSLFIPGSSASDILLNAFTGKPTAAQIFTNTGSPYQDCVTAIQHMRQVAPGSVPANAEAKCGTDLNAYVKLIGGTAEQQAPTTLWAWAILLGVVGGTYLVTR